MLSFGAAVIAAVALGATLSVDALSVAMSIGARMHGKLGYRNYGAAIFWFTAVHILMLSSGFLLGDALAGIINGVGPWISFTLLGLVGGTMIRSALKDDVEEENLMSIPPLTWKTLVPLAFACSIDAVAVGSSLGLSRNLPFGLTIICVALATIIAVACGLYAGNKAGEKWEKPAEIVGGIVLVFIGLKSFV
ncbi:manganese efflux pump MntP family protein [Alloscardovia theropitheci]|nr:manganese efflux pump [Alloscardovia theropitheci]